jgi:hypothetical protein
MCERPDAMTPERLATIEGYAINCDTIDSRIVFELVEEIKLLWDDMLSMVPVEQA